VHAVEHRGAVQSPHVGVLAHRLQQEPVVGRTQPACEPAARHRQLPVQDIGRRHRDAAGQDPPGRDPLGGRRSVHEALEIVEEREHLVTGTPVLDPGQEGMRHGRELLAILVGREHGLVGHQRPPVGVLGERRDDAFEPVGHPQVVLVHERDQLGARLSQAHVARERDAMVAVEADHARTERVLLGDRHRVVGGTVVDDDHLCRLRGLAPDRLEGVGQRGCAVVHRDHDRHVSLARSCSARGGPFNPQPEDPPCCADSATHLGPSDHDCKDSRPRCLSGPSDRDKRCAGRRVLSRHVVSSTARPSSTPSCGVRPDRLPGRSVS
jgi:hypothetical protein